MLTSSLLDQFIALQRQVETELREFARFADITITAEQWAAVEAAQSDAAGLMRAGLGPATWAAYRARQSTLKT